MEGTTTSDKYSPPPSMGKRGAGMEFGMQGRTGCFSRLGFDFNSLEALVVATGSWNLFFAALITLMIIIEDRKKTTYSKIGQSNVCKTIF